MKMNSRLPILTVLAAVFLTAPQAFPAIYTWNGADPATWNTSDTNWLPTSGATPWDSSNGTTSTGNFTAAGNATVSGTVYVNAITYTAASGNFSLNNGTINLAGTTPTITVDPSRTLTIGSTLDGTAGLIKTGNGTLTLSAANTYTGNTTVSAGVLSVSNGSALGSGPVIVTGGTVASLWISGNITVANALTLNGGNGIGFTGQVKSMSGANTISGAITQAGRIAAYADSLTITGGMAANYGAYESIDARTGTTITISTNPFILGATGTLDASQWGTTVLNVSGNTWGTTWVNNGTLRTDVANALPSSSRLRLGDTSFAGAIVNLNGNDQTVAGISSNTANGSISATNVRTITSATAATLTSNQSANTLFDGRITGALALVKSGTGTLTLAGNSTYTGATTVSAGTMLVSGTLANTSGVTVSGGTLELGAADRINNAATLTLSGGTFNASTFTDSLGALTLSGNSFISLGSGAAIAFANSSASTWGASFTLDLTGFVSGSSLRFGTDASGLTGTQLAQFTATGFSSFGLDSSGYLTAVPEPATWALLAFSLTTVMVLRRRMRI